MERRDDRIGYKTALQDTSGAHDRRITANIHGMLSARYLLNGLHKIPHLTIVLGCDYCDSHFRIAFKSLSNHRKWCLEEEQLLQMLPSWDLAEVNAKATGKIHENG